MKRSIRLLFYTLLINVMSLCAMTTEYINTLCDNLAINNHYAKRLTLALTHYSSEHSKPHDIKRLNNCLEQLGNWSEEIPQGLKEPLTKIFYQVHETLELTSPTEHVSMSARSAAFVIASAKSWYNQVRASLQQKPFLALVAAQIVTAPYELLTHGQVSTHKGLALTLTHGVKAVVPKKLGQLVNHDTFQKIIHSPEIQKNMHDIFKKIFNEIITHHKPRFTDNSQYTEQEQPRAINDICNDRGYTLFEQANEMIGYINYTLKTYGISPKLIEEILKPLTATIATLCEQEDDAQLEKVIHTLQQLMLLMSQAEKYKDILSILCNGFIKKLHAKNIAHKNRTEKIISWITHNPTYRRALLTSYMTKHQPEVLKEHADAIAILEDFMNNPENLKSLAYEKIKVWLIDYALVLYQRTEQDESPVQPTRKNLLSNPEDTEHVATKQPHDAQSDPLSSAEPVGNEEIDELLGQYSRNDTINYGF